MKDFPQSLLEKLNAREENNSLRVLPVLKAEKVDFSSNDYLGFSQSETIFNLVHNYLIDHKMIQNGATGSRLLSGNHPLYPITEKYIAEFHEVESALLFNSGYDANIGFFSSVPQKGDIVLYDEYAHASIRDGIRLSNAQSYKFTHNDLEDLEKKLGKASLGVDRVIYIVTESVFSMDGDSPDLEGLINLAEKYRALVVIDEAHALGVFGDKGEGLVQFLHLHDRVFARIVTFGKALGCHGAAILGSEKLNKYLVNFARSFIYTTGLSPHSIATILIGYQYLQAKENKSLHQLKDIILVFRQEINMLSIRPLFVWSKSAIQSAILPGNDKVRAAAAILQSKGFDVKAILSPTVPIGQERLRFCLHCYNSKEEIAEILKELCELI
ncbi:aminotransferase class I/II-fold pyridoxal phosphate-dependent enzyme [Flavobacterium sp. '19STA2R22 D10 B1']|uniref:aminotransferase class I/II-fold pyridoxal phosphate-dependent enzyme n=1 Tax=Flavobacterium aerium TaxID=3037261 RepID=UPI00278BF7C3|nr:pyridoxal phosphate-dependent aminotransferase family protein [Flavobacterium sp. '19STA2R22 D10 B1']